MRVLRVQAYCTRAAVLLLCFASGLELPQLRASIAVATASIQARALLQPSCCTTLTLFCVLCAGLDERYPTRCGGSYGMQILPRKQCLTIKFSRGAAPRTPRA